MSTVNDCLVYLKENEWLKLNNILSDEKKCKELASDPIFKIFETNLVSEIQRFENKNNQKLSIILVRIFHLNQDLGILQLSKNCINEVTEYLFQKHPSEKYAKILIENEKALQFLEALKNERTEKIEETIISANLNIKVGQVKKTNFSKSIFNSPQEEELYYAAKSFFNKEIILPNVSLSVIIDSSIKKSLNQKEIKFFFMSSIDLCIIDPKTHKGVFFIELDSSWHDKPKQIENDEIKDEIFKKAGLTLHRLRKKENKQMKEVFELFLKKNYNS